MFKPISAGEQACSLHPRTCNGQQWGWWNTLIIFAMEIKEFCQNFSVSLMYLSLMYIIFCSLSLCSYLWSMGRYGFPYNDGVGRGDKSTKSHISHWQLVHLLCKLWSFPAFLWVKHNPYKFWNLPRNVINFCRNGILKNQLLWFLPIDSTILRKSIKLPTNPWMLASHTTAPCLSPIST